MTVAGYSGTPLDRKLGVTPGRSLLVTGEVPDGFVGTTLVVPDGVDLASPRGRGRVDLIVVFVTTRARLADGLPTLLRRLAADGACWVAWPKRASKVPTDVTEDVVREVALPLRVVDNKVAAVDEVWSGLRLVVRLEHRAGW